MQLRLEDFCLFFKIKSCGTLEVNSAWLLLNYLRRGNIFSNEAGGVSPTFLPGARLERLIRGGLGGEFKRQTNSCCQWEYLLFTWKRLGNRCLFSAPRTATSAAPGLCLATRQRARLWSASQPPEQVPFHPG